MGKKKTNDITKTGPLSYRELQAQNSLVQKTAINSEDADFMNRVNAINASKVQSYEQGFDIRPQVVQ